MVYRGDHMLYLLTAFCAAIVRQASQSSKRLQESPTRWLDRKGMVQDLRARHLFSAHTTNFEIG